MAINGDAVGSRDACRLLPQGVGEECRTGPSDIPVEMDLMLFSNIRQTGEVVSMSTAVYVVQRFVVQQHALVCVLDELVEAAGSTAVSDTLGGRMIENVSMMRSKNSSRIFEIRSVPILEPVPPRE